MTINYNTIIFFFLFIRLFSLPLHSVSPSCFLSSLSSLLFPLHFLSFRLFLDSNSSLLSFFKAEKLSQETKFADVHLFFCVKLSNLDSKTKKCFLFFSRAQQPEKKKTNKSNYKQRQGCLGCTQRHSATSNSGQKNTSEAQGNQASFLQEQKRFNHLELKSKNTSVHSI